MADNKTTSTEPPVDNAPPVDSNPPVDNAPDAITKSAEIAAMDREIARQESGMGAILASFPTVSVKLRQNPEGQAQLQDPEKVWINGYCTEIPRGIRVDVPEPVFEVLERADLA